MSFDFADREQTTDTHIDFDGKKVNMLHVNGQIVETKHNKEKGRIEIP